MVVLPDEGIHRYQLRKWMATQLKRDFDVRRLRIRKKLSLLFGGEHQVPLTPDSNICTLKFKMTMERSDRMPIHYNLNFIFIASFSFQIRLATVAI